jgi:hypothetical protein
MKAMLECEFGRTDQTYYKPYVEVSKISNNVIDFDLQNIEKVLELDGKKKGVSADVIVGKQNDHFLDASRLIKRSFGNKFDCDFQLYNWGVALIADLGFESDRVDLLLLTYGRTSPNRITLMEFELIIMKHSNLTTFEKKERRQKWIDLLASFKIQAGRPKGGINVLTIGKRQLQAILDVNEVLIVFDLTVYVADLRRNDKYSNKLHSVLIEDPLISGKRLSRLGRGTLEEKMQGVFTSYIIFVYMYIHMNMSTYIHTNLALMYIYIHVHVYIDEIKRMELFSTRIAEEEAEEDLNNLEGVEDQELIESNMREAFTKVFTNMY